MKTLLLTLVTFLFIPTQLMAEEADINLTGTFNARKVIVKSDSENSDILKHDVNLATKIIYNIDNNIKYGAVISLETNAQNARSMPSFLFFESNAGRIELGSNKSAYSTLNISGSYHSCSESWTSFIPLDTDTSYLIGCNFSDSYSREKGKVEYARKISYYTPNIRGLKFGISFIPDSKNPGSGNPINENHKFLKENNLFFNVKDGIAAGFLYERDITDKLKIKTSISAETGINITDDTDETHTIIETINPISLGLSISYENLSFAASYTRIGELNISNNSTENYYWILGAKYKYQNFGFSLNYFHSQTLNNDLDVITLASDYFVTENVKTYAEFSHFNAESESSTKKNKGQIFIIGTKVGF